MNKLDTNQKRADGLDALRGFAILTMVLSGVIPYGVLPAWMYHAQLPPPEHQFNPNLPGLTWVDMVFPFFLFALGAAIPLALSRRLEKGQSKRNIILHIFERGFLLGFFAIFLKHVRAHVLNPSPETEHWLIALLGFGWMFLLFTRSPKGWSSRLKWSLKIFGWAGAVIILALLKYPDGSGFSLSRSDIIIVMLTNMAVFGSLIWLFTRNRLLLRLGILGILFACRVAHTEQSWVQWLWDFSPIPWIYKFYYLQYLFIVIPGTIIGDQIYQWLKTEKYETNSQTQWSQKRYISILIILILFMFGQLAGLQTRLLWQTTLLDLILVFAGLWLLKNPESENDKLLKTIFQWGAYWLILGLFFEPFEGGIKKDHPTLSYYFITTGLSIFLLMAFTILIDILNKKKLFQLLIDNGKNPMIAYVGFANFIWPVLALTGLENSILSITQNPWIGFLRGLIYTIIVALIVRFFTKKKIFWRT